MMNLLDVNQLAAGGPPGLPAPPTPLLGRDAEAAALRALLLDPAVRLVTVLGPAGVGKTRLALHSAASVDEAFRDGVAFVDLAALDAPAQVPEALAAALGLDGDVDPSQPHALGAALRGQRLLAVLDNVEHLLPAADYFASVLSACPGLTLLATSRAALRLRWERQFRLRPLPLPDLSGEITVDTAAQAAAVQLYVARTRAVLPEFSLTPANVDAVVRLCARLDGLPLALELAAAQAVVLPAATLLDVLDRQPNVLASRWRDLPARQQSLKSALSWSLDLLDGETQALFLQLAVFAGGATLPLIQTVCAPGEADASLDPFLLDRLATLVDVSLLERQEDGEGVRFRVPETVRHGALERLAERGDLVALRERHAAAYLALAEQADVECTLDRHGAWPDRLEREIGNFRAARAWWDGAGADPERNARLAAALYHFWTYRGYLAEGRHWLDDILRQPRAAAIGEAALADALYAAGRIAEHQGDFAAAYGWLSESIALFRRLGHETRLARALSWCASIAPEGSGVDLYAMLEESLGIYRRLDDRPGIAKTLNFLGEVARLQADYARAAAYYEESLALYEALGDSGEHSAVVRHNLGYIAQYQGDTERAAALFASAIDHYQLDRSARLLAVGVAALAAVALTEEPARALRLLAAAEASLAGMGAVMCPADQREHDRNVATIRTQLDATSAQAAIDEGRRLTIEQALADLREQRQPEAEPSHPAMPMAVLRPRDADLTPREAEVAALVARGFTNRQIAARLVISERTADSHVGNILGKLGFTSRAQVAAWAVEQGLLAEHAGKRP